MAEPSPKPEQYTPVELHLLLSEMRDERDRSRVREAAWISMVLHLLVVIALILSPRWMPRAAVVPLTAAELVQQQDKNLTFLQLPPDLQRPTQRPQTDIISDKDRIAQARQPQLNKRELDRILDAHRAGAPGIPAARPQPQTQAPPAQQPSPAPQQNQQQAQSNDAPVVRTEPGNQLARLDPPPLAGRGMAGFGSSVSPSTALEQAARATAGKRGTGGEFGLSGLPNTDLGGAYDVLSDTMGVDFGPYLARVMQVVRENWMVLIPEIAKAPMRKRGRVALEFAIMKDGSVAGLRLVGSTGETSFERAAYGAITGSNPFQPLPAEFKGQYLQLRFRFYYNPEKNDLR